MASATLSSVKPPAIKKGFVTFWLSSSCQLKVSPLPATEHQRADNRHWSQEELHLSPLEQRESFVGEGLARWFHLSAHAPVSGPSPQLGEACSLLLFVAIQNTDFLNSLWNPCSQLPGLLQCYLPFAWFKDETNVVRTGLNSGLDGFRSGQSAILTFVNLQLLYFFSHIVCLHEGCPNENAIKIREPACARLLWK